MPEISGSSHSSKNTRGRPASRGMRRMSSSPPPAIGERLGALGAAHERADHADHLKDLGDAALVERHDGIAAANQLGGDVGLQIGERQDQVGFERLDLVEPRVDERRYLRLADAPPAAAPCSPRCRRRDRLRRASRGALFVPSVRQSTRVTTTAPCWHPQEVWGSGALLGARAPPGRRLATKALRSASHYEGRRTTSKPKPKPKPAPPPALKLEPAKVQCRRIARQLASRRWRRHCFAPWRVAIRRKGC